MLYSLGSRQSLDPKYHECPALHSNAVYICGKTMRFFAICTTTEKWVFSRYCPTNTCKWIHYEVFSTPYKRCPFYIHFKSIVHPNCAPFAVVIDNCSLL